MASLEDLLDMEPGTPLVLASEHDWLQVCGYLVRATKRQVTLTMEWHDGKGRGPRKRYRLSDFERYELLDESGERKEAPQRNDILLFESEGVRACGYLGDITENRFTLQMASPGNLSSITYPGIWRWMRIGCDGPLKGYSLDLLEGAAILEKWSWKELYNPYSRPISGSSSSQGTG